MLLPTETVSSPTNYNIPDTVCVTPWINLEIGAQGAVTPCCKYVSKVNYKSITEFSLDDIVDDHTQVDLRQQFLQGQRPSGCQGCWQDEDNGKSSKRLLDQYVYRENLFEIDYNNVNRGKLLSLDIKLKNTCNLSCRICSPEFSSKWHSEYIQNYSAYPQWHLEKQNKSEWTDNTSSNLWTNIKERNDIQYLTFSGGEPLLDKSHAVMLKYFIDNNRSSKIFLHYNTNGTIYANQLIPLWNQFNLVELSFSIDNIGSKFEYERNGAIWENVVNNIKTYKKLQSPKYKLNVYSTVTVLNILDSYNLYNFCKQLDLPIVFNMLSEPEELNIKNLSATQKSYVINKFEQIQDDDFLKLITPTVGIMNQQSTIEQDKMINYLTVTDKIRHQDFRKTYTELSNILI
jgi:organic radical activating enzyme